MKLLFKLLATLCVALMVVSCASSTPEAAAKKYIQAIADGDINTIIPMVYLSNDQKNNPNMKGLLAAKVKSLTYAGTQEISKKNSGIKKITIGDIKYSNDNKIADVEIIANYRYSKELWKDHVKFININGHWKIKLNLTTPEAAAKKYIQAAYNGDADKVMSMMYIPDEQKIDPNMPDMLSKIKNRIILLSKVEANKHRDVKEITIKNIEYGIIPYTYHNSTKMTTVAAVKTTVTHKDDGKPEEGYANLINIDDVWKIDMSNELTE